MTKNYYGLFIFFVLLMLSGCVNKDEDTFTEEKIGIKFNDNITKLQNNIEGYTANFKGEYNLDASYEGIRTRLFNDKTTIDIYHDEFKGSIDTKETYFSYANSFIEGDDYHNIIHQERIKKNGYDINLIEWERTSLKKLQYDPNYYMSIEIAKNKFEIYTILIKSTEEIKNKNYILDNFKIIKKTREADELHFDVVEKKWNEETSKYYQKSFIDSNQLQWGLFDASHLNDLKRTISLEEKLDYKFQVLLRYQMIGLDNFPKEEMQSAYKDGRTIELTMQYDQKENILYEILNGKYDDYLNNYAKDLKEFSHPVLFRLNNEMNGDWVSYSSIHTSKDTDIYIEAWKYVYKLFENQGVDNVIWVWNPNHHSKPNFKWNHTLLYYPGSDYVDVIGLTAYNTGTYYEGEEWKSFDVLYDEIYYQYADWFDHPLIISEFASSSIGGDKTEWIKNMFETIPKYNRIRIAIWWSWQDFDANDTPSRIYLLDENKKTIESFRKGLTLD